MADRTEIKICGVTRPGDARLAVELGAWAIGLIFHPDSPRACELETAEQIGAELKRSAEVAGVFVNAHLDELERTADRTALTLLQLHGDEGPAYCAEAARRTGCRVIKAARIKDAQSVRALRAFSVGYHLLDAYRPGVRGGTGKTFDWELASRHERTTPLLLSGGLDASNVAEAIAAVRPFAVDVASGTESAPGVKDRGKLEAFFAAVAGAGVGVPAG